MLGFILRSVENNFKQDTGMTGFVFSSVENKLKEGYGDTIMLHKRDDD